MIKIKEIKIKLKIQGMKERQNLINNIAYLPEQNE